MKNVLSEKEDLSRNKVQNDQFGSWMKVDARKKGWVGSKVTNVRNEMREQEGNTIGYIRKKVEGDGRYNEVMAKGLLNVGGECIGEKRGVSEKEVYCQKK